MNQNFAKQVDIFREIDQAVRFGASSTDEKEVWKYVTYCVDYINGQRLKELIAKHGYPQPEDDSEFIESLTLLVIHQDFDVDFQKDYLEHAALSPQQRAWLEDRIAMNTSRPQKYGTLFGVEIENIDSVNELRAEVGLEAIEVENGMPKQPVH